MSRRATAIALAVAALLLAGPACGPDAARSTPAAASAPRLLLVGGRVFAGGDRCARRLTDMLAATGVAGDLRVELLAEPGADPARLAVLLRHAGHAGPATTVIAVLGDLALMDGIDPSAAMPVQDRITSRVIDGDAFDRGVVELERACDALGARLVIATPPLGIQGRVELPELVELAARLRQRRGMSLDLNAIFAAHEPGPLFANGIDVLDDDGHDLLAHAIYRSLLGAGAPTPPADAAQLRRRQLFAALHAWADGDDGALERALEQRLSGPSPDDRIAALQAALGFAARGRSDEGLALWRRLDHADVALPGLATGRLLAGVEGPAPTGFEGRVVDVLRALGARDAQAVDAARALTLEAPERIEAWILLVAANALPNGDRGVLARAQSRLAAFDGGPVSDERALALLELGPAALVALPALLAVGRPYEGALVTGPALRAARRRARVDMPGSAVQILDQAMTVGPCPPRWRQERDAIALTR